MITNKRNSSGTKDSINCYRQGGKFFQWSNYWPKTGDPRKGFSIETKEDRKAALEYYRQEDPKREYKAIKKDGFYEIFATDPQ